MLEPLLDPGTPLRTMGTLMLTVTLAAKEPGEHGLATDVAIRAIEEGRLGPDDLGPILRKLLHANLGLPGRWQKTFADIARTSLVHACVIQQSLQRGFVGEPSEMPRDYAKLLELLNELSIELGHGVSHEPCRAFLSGIKGSSSKAAKLAKSLLSLEQPDFSAADRKLLHVAIERRANTAKLWADAQ